MGKAVSRVTGVWTRGDELELDGGGGCVDWWGKGQNPECGCETENLREASPAFLHARHTASKAQWTVKDKSRKTGSELSLENIDPGVLIGHLGREMLWFELKR